jgi:hypothetical protein
VLGLLIELHPQQADLLSNICAGPTVTATDIPKDAGSSAWRGDKESLDQGVLPLA